jgi:predicted nicotinamide N-methyase
LGKAYYGSLWEAQKDVIFSKRQNQDIWIAGDLFFREDGQ